MVLNLDRLEKELSHFLDPTSLTLYGFDTLPSTNQTAWELLDSARVSPLVVIANQQTAGRGQWGRRWISETGGLYLSLALNLDLAVSCASHLVLATAWGIAYQLPRTYQIPVSIKWPNDLILAGRKLGGIKIETRITRDKITRAVIGVGINWSNPVPETGINLQSFWQDRSILSLEPLAAMTIAAIFFGYDYYLLNGIEALLSVYLERFENLGQEIIFEGCQGIVTGVNDRGELKVRLSSAGATREICLPTGTISLGYNRSIKG